MKNKYLKPQTIRITSDVERLLISTSVTVGDPVPKSQDGTTDLSNSEAKLSFSFDDEDDDSLK